MKKTIAILTALFALSIIATPAQAQLFRRSCPTGACPTSYRASRIAQTNYQSTYTPYSYYGAQQTVAPCEQVTTYQPAPCEQVTTVPYEEQQTTTTTTTLEPCAPVETVEPCAPVQNCVPGEYFPLPDFDGTVAKVPAQICTGGTCPIRTATKTATTAVKSAAQSMTTTARFLLAANRIRAAYGLPALRESSDLDAGCSTQANYCAATGTLTHGAGVAEILAQNYSGFDEALNQWLQSPGHRALLLNSSYSVAGAGITRDAAGRVWCAMRFR